MDEDNWMTPRDLVVLLEAEPGGGERLARAVKLARRRHAHLVASVVSGRKQAPDVANSRMTR